MISRVEHIGQTQSASWPKRLRRWLSDLFGSKYAQVLERELLQTRLDKDRQIAELRGERDRLLAALMASKGIPFRQAPSATSASDVKATAIPQTNWQKIQADAIAENARAEAEDAALNARAATEDVATKRAAKEN